MPKTIDQCPFCNRKLTVFYRMRTWEVIATCSDVECTGSTLEGLGNGTDEAKSNFHGKALRVKVIK